MLAIALFIAGFCAVSWRRIRSATCGTPLDPLFEGLPVTRWQDLQFREPYVALLSADLKQAIVEARGDRFTELRAVLRGPAVIEVAEK